LEVIDARWFAPDELPVGVLDAHLALIQRKPTDLPRRSAWRELASVADLVRGHAGSWLVTRRLVNWTRYQPLVLIPASPLA
jgi:hypothetical protein